MLEDIKGWDIGDIVAARGPVHKSGKGDLYVMMVEAQLLTKSLRPLPDKFHGLTDTEARYRQRYVDLIMNPDTRRAFEVRAGVIASIRRFFEARGFMEVETPMLQPSPGGAVARPTAIGTRARPLPPVRLDVGKNCKRWPLLCKQHFTTVYLEAGDSLPSLLLP